MKFTILIYFLVATLNVFSQDRKVELTREYDEVKKEHKIYVNNSTSSSQIITLTFTNAINIKCQDGRDKVIKTIKRGNRILFTRVKALDPTRSFNFGFSYTSLAGDHRPKPEFDYPYLLPVKPGKITSAKTMTYLNNEYGKDEKPKDWYSITLSTTKGDTIYASRGGVVTLVSENKEENKTSGLLFDRNTNSLIIEHKDGTFADYNLFENNGIIVKEGEQVIPGQALGIVSGENYANGSHLRFNVRYYHIAKNEDLDSHWAYVKLHFLTEDGVQEIDVNTPYKSIISKEVIAYEMSRREKKKYMKNKD